jgi:glutamine amidotransferase
MQQSEWSRRRSTRSAHVDPEFDQACATQSHAWIVHVRLATVGDVVEENTHPFIRGQWCFAHNGTIDDRTYLQSQLSSFRNDERNGNTDSELFFAYLLTRFDRAAVLQSEPTDAFDQALLSAVRDATGRENFGALNFVMSNGKTLFVHRFGRTLWYRREPGALMVASEPWDSQDNGWTSLSSGQLMRADIERDTIALRTIGAEM